MSLKSTPLQCAVSSDPRIDDPAYNGDPESVGLINQQGTTQTRGMEALANWKIKPWKVMASFLCLDTEEPGAAGEGRREIPLTPAHSVGVV